MATPLELAVGVAAVALGLAWVVRPARMNRLQTLVLYLGRVEPREEYSGFQLTLGRLSGAVLAVLGAVLALDLYP